MAAMARAGVALVLSAVVARVTAVTPFHDPSLRKADVLLASESALQPLAEGPAPRTCDASWCDCKACATPTSEGQCNLCSQKWVFIISTGRAGSTSILEGLNALPGVSLSGENLAMLNVAKDMVVRTDKLMEVKGAAAFESRADNLPAHTLCAMQQVFARLSNGTLNDSKQILGFKELVSIPSLNKWTSSTGKPVPHFSAWTSEWLDFIDRQFPCSRIVFNTRRSSAAQALAIAGTFKNAKHVALHHIEKEVRGVNSNLAQWHEERSSGAPGKSRSFMMYTEDFTPARFTELAQWLGLNCKFDSIPHANDRAAWRGRIEEEAANASASDKSALLRPYFHSDYENINVTCSAEPVGSVALADKGAPKQLPADTFLYGYEDILNKEEESFECQTLPALPQHPTCAPPAEQVLRLLSSEDATWDRSHFNLSEVPTFYLHEEGPFNFSDVVSCYMHAVGGTNLVDDIDKYVYPDVAEHLADIWMLEQFRKHPRRVHRPEEASIHVMGAPFVAAFRAHRGEQWDPEWKAPREGGPLGGPYGCGTMGMLSARLGKIAQYLKNSYYFKRDNGRDWLLLNSYYWVKDALGDELLQLSLKGPMMFTSSDRDYKHFRELRSDVAIEPEVIPYKSHFALDDAAWVDAKYPILAPRPHNLMFHGSTGRGLFTTGARKNYSEGALRDLMCHTIHDAFPRNSSFRCFRHYHAAAATSLLQVGEDAGHESATTSAGRGWLVTSGRRASDQTVKAYKDSKLCLVPAGDTPSSRRLFDAMAGGCVPVIFTPFADIAPNLPFPKSVNWRKLALFAGGLSCSIQEHGKDTIAWLRELLDPVHAAKLDCLSKRVRSAYRKHLSLRGKGSVTALLLELQRNPKHSWLRPKAPPRKVLRPQLDKTCHVEARCGCRGRDTVFVRYHVTAQRLTQGLIEDLEEKCDIADSKYVDVDAGLATSGRPGACRSVKLTLDEDNLDRWPLSRLRELARARNGTHFVHVIREPLGLVAEYYAKHVASREGADGSLYPALWANLTQLSEAEGMMHVAELVMRQHLPAMAELRTLFSQACAGTEPCPMRDDVTEVRLGDLHVDFGRQVGRIARAAGVAERCAAKGAVLRDAFERRKPSHARSLSQPGALESVSEDTDAAALAAVPRVLASLLSAGSQRSANVVRRLQDFGRVLGYTY